jgi:hypothetical protein
MEAEATMNRFPFTLALLLAPLPVFAQHIYVYPGTVTAPRGSYQTVTAIVTGVNDKTVTWHASGGTVVGTNPCVVNEPCAVALYTTTPGIYTLTATSNANNSIQGMSEITITPSPVPVTTHPRLYVTAAMLPGLQAKAAPANRMYQALRQGGGMGGIDHYKLLSAAPYNWSWTANGGTGLPATGTSPSGLEGYANLFAFLSMIDPSDRTYHWGSYGRDVWVYLMKQVVAGGGVIPTVGQDEARRQAVPFVFTTDWLMAGNGGAGFLSSADQTVARQYIAVTLQNLISDNPLIPNGPYNSPSEFASRGIGSMRIFGNNYQEAWMLYWGVLPLTFNDTTLDDPPLANTCSATRYQVCNDGTAGSMHAYFKSWFVGAVLYLNWAHLEDPNVSWQAYQASYANLPTIPSCYQTGDTGTKIPCFGDGRGGESSEGSGYGTYIYALRTMMNAIHTAGWDDPILYGPQISLGTSSFWDLWAQHDSEFLTGMVAQNGPNGGGGDVSPAYSYLTTGSVNSYYQIPGYFGTEASMLTFDSYIGRTDNKNTLLWPIMNTAFGGPLGTAEGCTGFCGFDATLTTSYGNNLNVDLFISLPASDPQSSLPSDPRSSMPTDVFNGSFNQHQTVRSGFTNSDTLFTTYCPSPLNNHELPMCGTFDIYSKNEWITKHRVMFDSDYNNQMMSSPQSNELSVMNVLGVGTAPGGEVVDAIAYGGQWWGGEQVAVPVPMNHSELPAYSAAIVDMKNLYNGMWWNPTNQIQYNNVTEASRSIIYLPRHAAGSSPTTELGDQQRTGKSGLPEHDRNSHRNGRDRFLAHAVGKPEGLLYRPSRWNTVQHRPDVRLLTMVLIGRPPRLLRRTAGTPTSDQFLHVLEWGASSFSKTSTSLVQSTAGQNFDGSLVGSSLVMFERNWPATFTGVTYPASGATKQYVSDLTPNTTYNITGTGAPATATSDTAGVLTFSAAGTGNIVINGTGTVSSVLRVTQGTSLYVAGHKIPIGITLAVASLLSLGQWAHRRHRPGTREGMFPESERLDL